MSIANDKGTDITQLEFQSVGKASTSTTLIQPLLEHASTYNCHIMNLVTSLGDQPAVPTQQLLRLAPNPFCTTQSVAGNNKFAVPYDQVDVFANDANGNPFGVDLEASTFDPVEFNDVWAGSNPENEENFLEAIKSGDIMNIERYSYDLNQNDEIVENQGHDVSLSSFQNDSSLDFVWDLALQTRRDKDMTHLYKVLGNRAENLARATATTNDLIKVCVNLKGNLTLKFKTEIFRRGLMVLFTPFFRKLTGTDKHFVTGYWDHVAEEIKYVYKVEDWPIVHDPRSWNLQILNQQIPGDGPRISVAFGDSIFEQADFRKKLIMDVTFPIDATIVVKDEKPEVLHQLQEFELRPGVFNAKFGGFNKITGNNFVRCNVIQQEQFLGPRVLLDNSTSLAVKKLFEGQMQTIRVDLVLEYQEWEEALHDFVDKRVPLEFDQGMFNYMKFIFCKEVV